MKDRVRVRESESKLIDLRRKLNSNGLSSCGTPIYNIGALASPPPRTQIASAITAYINWQSFVEKKKIRKEIFKRGNVTKTYNIWLTI